MVLLYKTCCVFDGQSFQISQEGASAGTPRWSNAQVYYPIKLAIYHVDFMILAHISNSAIIKVNKYIGPHI